MFLGAFNEADKVTLAVAAGGWVLAAIPAYVAARHGREAVRQAKPPSNSVTNGYYAENGYFLLVQLVDLWRAERGLPPLDLPQASDVYGRRIGDHRGGGHDAGDDDNG